ncbi:hypothetical protein MBANPS3_004344 [Mucor bainieri]
MAPSTATTTQLNGHYANQYPNHNNKLPPPHLPHNKAYTRYAPNVIIALSSLYVREKQHLKQTWKKVMAKFELQSKHNLLLYPDSAYNNKEQSYNSSATSFTLHQSSCTSPTSPSTTAVPTDIGSSVKLCHQPPSPSSSLSSFATTNTAASNSVQLNNHPIMVESVFSSKALSIYRDSMSHNDRPFWLIFSTSNKLVSYWKISNNKRLNLLWQWSVAMGYCEYSHAKDLDDMVRQLQGYNHDISTCMNREGVVLEDE